MLSEYLLPEAVYKIQAVTPPRHGQEWNTSLGTFQYYSIKQERFWGYRAATILDTHTTLCYYML